MNDQYQILVEKLDEFIRKYYKNQMIRGLLYFLAVSSLFFLMVIIIEYIANFDIGVRTFLFYLFSSINVIIIWRLILIPFFRLLRIGNIISYEQAARIIGTHFTGVQDKLLNTLQLRKMADEKTNDLIIASIDQRIKELRPVPFKAAITFRANKKYLKYALPPLILILLLLATTPRMITEPARRIVNYNVYYEKEKPFELYLLNDDLKVVQHEHFVVDVGVRGDIIPDLIYLATGNNLFKMSRKEGKRFQYQFRSVQNNTTFALVSGKYRSRDYEIKVLPKPIVLNFDVFLDYPDYTEKTDETIENTGDLTIPEGTEVTWRFYTRDTEKLTFSYSTQQHILENVKSNTFTVKEKFTESTAYSVKMANPFMENSDSLFYTINVIPDLYPAIFVEELQDSVYDSRVYFRGTIKDDYGFTRLLFQYSKKSDIDDSDHSQELNFNASVEQQQFFHSFDFSDIKAIPGDEITYFFEVWDNDAVNGNKSSRTQKMIFRVPTLEEIEESAEKSNSEIKSEMEKAMKEVRELQHDIEELSKKMVEKQTVSWQEKQAIQDLINRHEALQKKIETINQENVNKSIKENQYKNVDEELLEKQRQLEELFEKVLTEDMKEMIREMQDLLDQLDKDKVKDMLEQMKMSGEDIEEQLDRSLELFKQLEFEKGMKETVEKLENLAEEQENLAKETEEGRKEDSKELQEKQSGINEKYDDIRKELDKLNEMNEELEFPNKMEETDQEEESIQEDMENSMNELQQNRMGKAGKSQKSASDKMKNLGGKLSEMLAAMQMENLGEDIFALREILENLLQVSFDQEELMEEVRVVRRGDPRYVALKQEQKKLKDDIAMIEDSLKAVARRQRAIEPVVSREIREIDTHMEATIESLENRHISGAVTNQQFVMTSVNNLALLLAESMEQMQMDMASMASGSKSCPNPGRGKGKAPSIGTLRQLQEQLNRQMEQLKKGMEQQGKEGMKLPGQKSLSEQLARMAAQQEAIREQMQQYMEGLKEEGIGVDGDTRKMIEDMEKTETDLVNKMITNQTLMRQQEIVTRLLESERAERERKQEEIRESKESKSKKISNPEEIFEYKSINLKQVEMLNTVPPSLKPYYKQKVNQYLFNFGGE